MNVEDLFERAKWGTISEEEVDDVAGVLLAPGEDADRYKMLYVLGRTFSFRHRHVIEGFLESKDDPMLARLALEILGQMWDEAGEYLDQVKRFLYGVEWDEEDGYFVRQMAISVSGSYLRDHPETELLGELLFVFQDEDEDDLLRQDAYLALGRAMGRDWDELPSPARKFDVGAKTGSSVVEEAKQRLAEDMMNR